MHLLSSQRETASNPLDVPPERELCIDNPLVRIHFIIVMIRWTGLAPWEFEFSCPRPPISPCTSLRYCFYGPFRALATNVVPMSNRMIAAVPP